MALAREIRRRIKSVDNTRQITRTMEMVATSKLRRAMERVEAAKPYGAALGEIVAGLHDPELAGRFPLLRRPEEPKRAAVMLLTSNRGLCGAFNANLIKEANRLLERLRWQGIEPELHVVGRKGVSYYQYRGEPLASVHTDFPETPGANEAAALVAGLRADFETGRLDAVWVVSAHFRSALSAPPVAWELLPLADGSRSPGENDAEDTGGAAPKGMGAGAEAASSLEQFILSPDAEQLLRRILPLYLRNAMYRAVVENVAAEQAARRTAMHNATDNAGDILENLTRTYNRVRQGQITQEIAEIVGGAAALE